MFRRLLLSLALTAPTVPSFADDQSPPVPDAVVDLRSAEGLALVRGEWRALPAQIISVEHRAVGPDKKPSGPPNRTHDISPKAGAAKFDDCRWPVIDPTALEERIGDGRLSFAWYRVEVTIPDSVGSIETRGATIYFEIVADDYAEVWIDGRLPVALGQAGGSLVAGWNSPNRVLLTASAEPGRTHQVAILVGNGPLSDPPPNYIWLRSATLDIYAAGSPKVVETVPFEVLRLDPAIDDIIPYSAELEKLADGFVFTEGPVWVDDATMPGGGYLLFSDPNKNIIHRWSPDGSVSIFRTKSGYAGVDIGEYRQPGSNGLAVDCEGRLSICEHGNRRVTRLEKNGTLTVLACQFDGRRLNSPNDLVYRSDGALYFTDPAFGLPRVYDDPRKELSHQGVYCLIDGELKLVSTDLKGPNGLALSPDEKRLYVANWDESKKIVMCYDVQPDGALSNGRVFFDMTAAPGEEALDGLKVDEAGNVYVSGPVGVWILSPEGKHLGTLIAPELPANFAWGDADRRTLYLTARTGLYRIRLNIAGARFNPEHRQP